MSKASPPYTTVEEADLMYYTRNKSDSGWLGWSSIAYLMSTESHPARSDSAYRRKYHRMMKKSYKETR